MMVKKILALFMAVLLMTSCFTACSPKKEEEEQEKEEINRPEHEKVTLEVDAGSTTGFKFIGSRAGDEPTRKLTIINYIIGADLESDSGCATEDMQEMAQADPGDDNINLLIYTGGCEIWHCGAPTNGNMLFRYNSGDDAFEVIAETESACNMGNAQTLTDLLDFCADVYPAERYGLILWDHGGGSVYGYGNDELYNDSLLLPELDAALKNSVFGGDKKLEFIGFDACLMATLETALVLSPYANYMIASEETEPGVGWNYAFLSGLTGSESGAEIAGRIIESYKQTEELYKNKVLKNDSSHGTALRGKTRGVTVKMAPDLTLSCLDLSKTGAAVQALDALSEKLDADLSGSFTQISRIRGDTKEFAAGFNYDHIDLGHFASLASELYAPEADSLAAAIRSLVVNQMTNVSNAYGVSSYFPYRDEYTYKIQGGAEIIKFLYDSHAYGKFLTDFYTAYTTGEVGGPGQSNGGITVDAGEMISLQLSADELATLAEASYSIYEKTEKDTLQPMIRKMPVKPDENGVLRVPKEQKGVYIRNSEGNGNYCSAVAVENDDERTVLKTVVMASTDETYMPYVERRYLTVLLALYPDDSMEIINILCDDDDFADRKEPDIYDDTCLMTFCPSYIPAEEDGITLPFSEWEKDSVVSYNILQIADDIYFDYKPLDTMNTEYLLQFNMTDVYGNEYCSEFYTPETPDNSFEYHMAEVDVPDGKLTFAVYEDHAEMLRLEGETSELTVPDTVDGKPVTVIGYWYYNPDTFLSIANPNLTRVVLPDTASVIKDDAFRNCSNLTSVKLPSYVEQIGARAFMGAPLEELELPGTLKRIGGFAFYSCGVSKITIPASVESVGEGAFSSCDKLQWIEAEGGAGVKSVDGVLFTGDGAILLVYPAGRTDGSYKLPSGTLRVGDSAFAYAENLVSLTANAELLEIGAYAFYEDVKLQECILPDCLQRIGAFAFYKGGLVSIWSDVTPFNHFYIGRDVNYIGMCAFTGLNIKEFEVSRENAMFSANGSFLLDASGTVLVSLGASPADGVLIIPDGVVTIMEDALESAREVKVLVLPDSVMNFRYQSGLWHLETLSIGANVQNIVVWNLNDDVKYEVSMDNPYLKVKKGKLYTVDGVDLTEK